MKYNLLILCLASTLSSIGQITLNAEGTPLNTVISSFKKAYPLNPGSAGPNQIWDFSTMQPTNSDQVFEKLPVGNVPVVYMPSFPSTDFAFKTHAINTLANDTSYIFYEEFPDKLEVLGSFSGSNGSMCKLYNTEIERPIPFNYNDTFSDTFNGSVFASSVTSRVGTVAAKYDGYGTLILPDGTYENVARIKKVKSQTDTYNAPNGDILITTIDVEAYAYFINSGLQIYTFAYTNIHGTFNGVAFSSPEDTSGTYFSASIAELEKMDDTENQINLYPNPCVDALTIDNATSFDHFLIVDMQGNIIRSSAFESKINISDLKSGSYYLVLSNRKVAVSKKFEKI